MKMQDVLAEKLKDIDVSVAEVKGLKKLASDLIGVLEKNGLKAFVGGSLAKGTLIKKEEQDIDIFVVFKSEKEIAKLGKILNKVKLPGELKLVHGSRDYFQILTSSAKLELIPTVEAASPDEAQNVTDVSLSHVKYVVGAVKKNKGLGDEIKLAKAFCSAQKFYGAESYIKGFSGYSLEVLVIHYGSFVNFLRGVGKLRGIGSGKRRIIDPKKYFKNEKQVLFELNAAKLQSPLIVVDPTYKYRNVSAGLGDETFLKFLDVAKRFLKRPSVDFFDLQEIDLAEMKKFAGKKRASLFEVDLMTDRQEGDIAGTKCRKFLDFFVDELKRNGQKVLRKEFDYVGTGKKAKGFLIVKEKEIVEVRGPPVGMKESVKGFKKEHGGGVGGGYGGIYVKKGMLWAKKEVSVKGVFEFCNKKVAKEMGSWGEGLKKL